MNGKVGLENIWITEKMKNSKEVKQFLMEWHKIWCKKYITYCEPRKCSQELLGMSRWHNGHSRYQNLNLTCWFLVSGVKITSIWGLSIHYFINLVIFSSKITISKSNFLDDCPNHIYLYTLESYVRHQKIS